MQHSPLFHFYSADWILEHFHELPNPTLSQLHVTISTRIRSEPEKSLTTELIPSHTSQKSKIHILDLPIELLEVLCRFYLLEYCHVHVPGPDMQSVLQHHGAPLSFPGEPTVSQNFPKILFPDILFRWAHQSEKSVPPNCHDWLLVILRL